MTKYEGPDLIPVEPKLRDGKRKVITYFHDECCFHALDYKDNNGNIIADAREIIYPGLKGDAWWDTEQLLKQIKHAIAIHNHVQPDTIALFVFDQSSAHALLLPNALNAWNMNKSNGGKQKLCKDTIIPQSNPSMEQHGQWQKMTMEDGLVKGMEVVLTERGFNVLKMKAKCSPVCPIENKDCCMAQLLSHQEDFKNQILMLAMVIQEVGHECIFLLKFHCELNPIEIYWGWCKYCYHQVPKTSFEDSKQLALQYLDTCSLEMICQFIN
ncbi:hypothetical protein IW261DRAFT_1553872 [Armillaria novae-zelandiae]|uniref:Uncharacterized protein n=1 Tax=Armillaria novae-zelandiae TaxID=153914 RepID=A0AA39T6C3_9AGAR|nr:hypothetical protein IW261DRAFT_1553872 [Armillaria novae-zelandiae]